MRKMANKRELWKAVLLEVLDSIPDEKLRKVWKQTEQPGTVLVLTVGRRRKGIGFEVIADLRVDEPLTFGK
jgi:hypothetical protein